MTQTRKPLSSNELRARFLEFFRSKGHEVVASSSLVPGDDPTLLFTNAGMVQFKDVFLGKDRRPYTRAASSQRCVRAGGKHNDLENVGYTARHHTFFEMLGNFSFGDYFKRDAILFAWEFVTGKDWLGIDPARLMVTVYKTDDEAYTLWNKEVGLAPERIVRIGDKPGGGSDNFWQMGETGPCGPCSEIFYDHGAGIPGGPPGSPDADGDRWIEIWNLVFMQYDRSADGKLTPLPKPSVDTGMGLERVAAVMQGVHSNYEIDLFQGLIAAAAQATKTSDLASSSLKVIADHIRACSFLIIDGVLPSNEGRGYVLRRIIRRAIRHGYKLGTPEAFFYKLVAPLELAMGDAYPELSKNRAHVERVLQQEELRFAETLATGMAVLDAEITKLMSRADTRYLHGRVNQLPVLSGEIVFKLYDTHGFPVDLTADIARERGLTIDEAGFESAMQAQRERARAASKFGVSLSGGVSIEGRTDFRGYEGLIDNGQVVALIKDGAQVESLREGEEGQVILDRTPFYAESGGQVGDTGVLTAAGSQFIVRDTRKAGRAHAHIGLVTKGELKVGDTVRAEVNAELRRATALNHTATHLLHAALRKVLGTHVTQKGSLVAPDRLRFDFSHYQPLTAEELKEIERRVNAEIRANAPAETQVMDYESAVAAGAMALFGEKYEGEVRVLRVGEFSMELCGGTHVQRAGDIGFFKIVGESGVASGVRRIEALTGEGALNWVEANEALVREMAALVRGSREDVRDKIGQLIEKSRQLEKEVQQLKSRLASGGRSAANRQETTVGATRVAVEIHEGLDVPTLRQLADAEKNKGTPLFVAISGSGGDKTLFVVASTVPAIKANAFAAEFGAQIGGKGGGRGDFAQGGGTDLQPLSRYIEIAEQVLPRATSAER